MTITGLDALFYTLAFVVPGFILQLTISTFVPRKAEQAELSFLRFLAFSCLNYAIWSWLIYIIIRNEFYIQHPYRTAAIWFGIILISPFILGLLIARLSDKGIHRGLLHRFGFTPIHEIPTAWDYKFSKTENKVWLLVTLKDDSRVAGLFGSDSFASSDPTERDLYIQEIYSIKESGQWERIPNNNGILISSDQIKHIEYWNDKSHIKEANHV